MYKRRQNFKTDEDGLVVIGEHEPPRTFIRCVLHWFGEAIIWVLAFAPPLLIILYGVDGLRSGQLRTIKMGMVISGDAAISLSWISIGIGIGFLGNVCCYMTGRPVFRLLGWILAVGTFGLGVWILIR